MAGLRELSVRTLSPHYRRRAISFAFADFGSLSSRKKIKCDGCEPTCSQCSASGSQCTWLQTKDRAALSRQCVVFHPSLPVFLTSCVAMCKSSKRACFTWKRSSSRSHPSSRKAANL